MYHGMLEPFCVMSLMLRKAALVYPTSISARQGRPWTSSCYDINLTFVITQFMIANSGREYCTLQVLNWRPSLSLGVVWNISRYVVIDAEN